MSLFLDTFFCHEKREKEKEREKESKVCWKELSFSLSCVCVLNKQLSNPIQASFLQIFSFFLF
jgi:hypothetical protein